MSGILCGTTFFVGNNCTGSNASCGVVFNITTASKETVLYRFGGSPDGAWPHGGLLNVDGTLYGTTQFGGAHGHGTIYSITTAGIEKVLHSFVRHAGAPSKGRLLLVRSMLYGTTAGGYEGAEYGYGTIFTLKP